MPSHESMYSNINTLITAKPLCENFWNSTISSKNFDFLEDGTVISPLKKTYEYLIIKMFINYTFFY